MAEALLDDLRVDAGRQCKRGPRMAQVVQANRAETTVHDSRMEALAHKGGVERQAIFTRKQPVAILPRGTRRQTLSCLTSTPALEHGQGANIQGHRPPPGARLGRHLDHAAADGV